MIYSFLYVVIASMGLVLIQYLDALVPPLFSLFFTSLIAALFFNAINFGKLRHLYRNCWKEKWSCLGIMITILIMWICSMVAPGLIGASLSAFLYFTWLGMLGFFASCWRDVKNNIIKFLFGICAMLLIGVAFWNELQSGFNYLKMIGILFSFVGGTCLFIYFKQSQYIIKRIQLSATQILAIRFYLTIIVLFIFLPKSSFQLHFTSENMLVIIILAILTMIAPLFFMQKALEKITAEQNSIIMSLTPAVTGCIQEFIFNDVTKLFFIIYVLYSVLITASCLLNRQKK